MEDVERVTEELNAVVINDDQVAQMRIPEIKAELGRRGLRLTGRKIELVTRLKAALLLERERVAQDEEIEDEDDDDEDDNDEDDSAVANRRARESPVSRRRGPEAPKTLLLLKDVENSLEKFSGDDLLSVNRWLEDFEEMATVCGWTDVHMVAFGKKMLTGSAQSFVRQERCTKTWAKFKKALKDEFENVVCDQQIHRELSQCRKKFDETLQQYMYRVREIAAQGRVDTQSVIGYIIQGIPDDVTNKTMLYGAKNMQQLKERFKQYETMKQEAKTRTKTTERRDDKLKRLDGRIPKKKTMEDAATVRRCFNCGDKNHTSAECPSKSKGAKCFKCNEFGHIASKCPTQSKESYVVSRPEKEKYMKEVTIENCKFVALVDTGSDLTFMRSDEYTKLGSPTLGDRKLKFEGFGSTGNETWGELTKTVIVDGNEFPVVFHVISNTILRKHSLLLGTDFLDQVELRVKRGKVSFLRLDGSDDDNADTPIIFKIDLVEQTDEVDLSHVKVCHRDEIQKLVKEYKPEKTRDVGIKTKIILKSDVPVVCRPRRLAQSERREVNDLMKVWIDEGIIRPSNSEYASPIVLVKKKNGSTRVCVDYRGLNKLIERPRFPLPLIEDQLDSLQGGEVFTTIDLKNGFFHVPVDEKSQKYTAFVTPDGQYEFLKTPFGLSISPIIFQKFIITIFKELIDNQYLVVYMDDLIILAKNDEEGMKRLKHVLSVAGQHGLCINWEKCRFLQTEIEYLGHIVSKNTVKPSEGKTRAVTNFPRPTTVKRVQSFLGLTGYFRKFIRGYAKIARPLTELLKKGIKFKFEDREIEAFEMLKSALISRPVLRLYRVGAKTELHTDAAGQGYGAILMQLDSEDGKFHPVFYASGKPTPAEEKYTSYELEVLAIVKALKKFRVYLLGIPFAIVTDCKAFTMTMRKKDLCVRVARWALLLEEFNYEVFHRPGKSMQHVDALSRNPLPCTMLITEDDDGLIARLIKAQHEDENLQKTISAATRSQADGYMIRNKLLYKEVDKDVLVVVPKSMQTQVVRQAHEREHFGVNKTEAIVRKDFWFKGVRKKVEKVIKTCMNCILAEGDLVAIKRTQFGQGLKLRGKFLGPYKVTRVMRNDRYAVEKVGEHEGPRQTSTSADYMKQWGTDAGQDAESDDSAEEDKEDI